MVANPARPPAAIVPVENSSTNPLETAPPEPGAAFQNRIIHPRNMEIEERRERSRILTKQELVQYQKQLNRLNAELDTSGYDEMMIQAKLAWTRYQEALTELNNNPTEERTEELHLVIAQRQKRIIDLKQQLTPLKPLIQKRNDIMQLFGDHTYAIKRKALHDQLAREMAKEVFGYEQIMVDAWARMGYQHQIFDSKKKKTLSHRVSFSDRQVTPDAIYFKIRATVKGMFGFKNALPYGVRVQDLVSEESLKELEIATQRQITAEVTKNNGAWVVVHRLQTRDGILEYVPLGALLKSYPHNQREQMPLPIGVGEGRQISWVMLTQHPHFLIAGSSGNGKSNLTNVIVSTLVSHHSPDELRLCLIDLKEGAEFAAYETIPHLLMPVIKSPEEAVTALGQMDSLRAERMKSIAAHGCRDINEFNRRYPGKRLFRVVVFVDEYARVKSRGKDVKLMADRLAEELTALGRAAGVHLFAATQTPYTDTLPGSTKANMAMRIAFALPSAENSKSIVGNGEAANLPTVKGRAVVAMGSRHWQVQTPHCQVSDIEQAVGVAMAYDKPAPIELASTFEFRVFDENRMLDMVLNELGGRLSTRAVYMYAREFDNVSEVQVDKLVKDIINRGYAEFEGERYKPQKKARAYELIPDDSV